MRRYTIQIDDQSFTIDVQEITANRFYVLVDGKEFEVDLTSGSDLPESLITPQIIPVPRSRPGRVYKPVEFEKLEPLPRTSQPPLPQKPQLATDQVRSDVIAPMPGVILEVRVKEGDHVRVGDPLAVLEAMKMKNVIKSPVEGKIQEILVTPGQQVNYGDVLVRYEA